SPAAATPAKEAGAQAGPADGSAIVAGIRLTRANTVRYEESGITKLDLARYYDAVADWALPHLANRPLSLVRCPEGHTGECFFQKHETAGMPPSIHRYELAEKAETETSLYIEDLAGLVGL